MSWNKERIDAVALASAPEDYAAFEAIGLSEIEGARVVDFGAFDGFNTVLKFSPYQNIAEVIGVDPSEDALSKARRVTDDSRFRWVAARCETFEGYDDYFDVAYFSHSFQHLEDKEAGLKTVMRVLKPGGVVIIKTVDDSCKVSYPDPHQAMRRLFELYEHHVLPHVAHTRSTDRNNGSKCYTLLKHAGFHGIAVRTTLADTAGKTAEQRKALFERCTYFRRAVPDGTGKAVADELKAALLEWEALFERDDYYYASPTFIAIAQKPDGNNAPRPYHGPLFGGGSKGAGAPTANSVDSRSSEPCAEKPAQAGWTIHPMAESDLGRIMQIELASFPDPWTPVAYAMELRHNPQGTYVVASNAKKGIGGYVGWWEANGAATIANIAVDPTIRRSGIGKLLIEYACSHAASHSCSIMQLQVRAQNETARAFYAAMGFRELSTTHGYYSNPDDDAVILARML